MLWRPDLHEPLTDRTWNDAWAREAVRAIVADVEAAFDPDGLWPPHDADAWWKSSLPIKDLDTGAAGVIFALDVLQRRAFADVTIDLRRAVERTLELWQQEPDFAKYDWAATPAQPSLFFGEGGLLWLAWRLTSQPSFADRLHARVRENTGNETNEVMWGAPGTMLAARSMHAWTGELRWLDAWSESADAVRANRDADGLWTQLLSGRESRYLGPAHGAVGNVLALLDGSPDEDVSALARTLERTAVVEDGLANWPSGEGVGLVPRDGVIRVQWCHGAPGIVTSAPYLDEELLLAGAELTWRAGPHGEQKGAGICHGTAGNGYALLKTFERTGDEQWLERARRFAVHALQQVERQGRGRYSLFTGDLGVALYAADCIEARARYPIMDTLSG